MFEVDDILIDNNATVSGILVVSGQLMFGPGGTDIAGAINVISGNLIQSGQILLFSDSLLNTAIGTLSGNLITSGQTLLTLRNLDVTAIGTLSGNLITSGQSLLANDARIETEIATLSGNLIASGQVTVPITHGGTGATTASGALNAISPATTSGDLIVYDGFVHARLAAAASGSVLFSDPTHTPGVLWKPKTTAFDSIAPTTTSGDLIVFGNATNTHLPAGTSGQIIVADPTQSVGMAWKTIDIDAQTAQATAATTTTSASFVDMAGATLTTTGRSNTKQYLIQFAGTFSSSANNTTMSLQFVVNGSANTNSIRTIRVGGTAGANFTGPMMSAVVTVAPGQIVKVQWDTSGGTLTLQAGTLNIFGIA